MKIKSIYVKNFKKFQELTISNLPESAKLIVLIGPNGCGKSSLFDAICVYSTVHSNSSISSFPSYYFRSSMGLSISRMDNVKISFHSEPSPSSIDRRKLSYVRSAYRNEPAFQVHELKKMKSVLNKSQTFKMIDNDISVSHNYTRLVSQALENFFDNTQGSRTLQDLRESLIEEIRDSVQELFPGLILNNLGNPLSGSATFCFQKGDIEKFSYANLSGGEKAAFDLILDLIIKRMEYNDTVFCIDEPEAHISMRIQKHLLRILYRLIPDNSQLWIATHSIGMMREAQDLHSKDPGKVVFLNFDEIDFDKPQNIEPAQMNCSLWDHIHTVALDDLANLILPNVLYLCESTHEKSFDADCYNTIFSSKYPDVKFVSVGSKTDVQRCALALQGATPGLQIIPLRDRDNMVEKEVQIERGNGVRILSRTCIEQYLLDDEVLTAFCEKQEFSTETLVTLKEIRDINHANPKKAAQDVRTHILNIDKSLRIGDNVQTFLKYSLATLIIPGMKTYEELWRDIFHKESR